MNINMEDRCSVYVGNFAPIRRDDLRAGLEKLIDTTKPQFFRYLWTNGDDESNYPGERCYEFSNADELCKEHGIRFIGWIPECDIQWAKRPRLLNEDEMKLSLEEE